MKKFIKNTLWLLKYIVVINIIYSLLVFIVLSFGYLTFDPTQWSTMGRVLAITGYIFVMGLAMTVFISETNWKE